MSVNFAFEFDDVYYDPCRMGLVFIRKGRDVMYSKNIPYETAMKILKESHIRIVIDRVEHAKASMNEISKVLDELLELHEEGEKLVISEYEPMKLKKLREFLDDFEKDCDALLTEGGELAPEST